MPLTDKQALFAQEYIVDLNATQAAIRAGYSFGSASSGFYVYFLVDPRDDQIFYVGKGKGKRSSAHVKEVATGKCANGAKMARIVDIQQSGKKVREIIFDCEMTESDAFAVERSLIQALRSYGLTNISAGLVSPEESAIQKAQALLAQLKPFDVWVAGMSQSMTGLVCRVFGSPETFYQRYRTALQECIENPWPSIITVREVVRGQTF